LEGGYTLSIVKEKHMETKNMTIKEAAKLMGKSQPFVRAGLRLGFFPFGTAFKSKERNARYDYYISPEKFRQYVEGKQDNQNTEEEC
jgi:hypothetical protein